MKNADLPTTRVVTMTDSAHFNHENTFAVLVLGAIIGALCVPYIVNSWLAYCGQPPQMTWVAGALIGSLGPTLNVIFSATMATYIAMMFLR